jgi:hypothetical protein
VNGKSKAPPARQTVSRKHLEFEAFLADLSARFIALPSEEVDEEIRRALKEIPEFFPIELFEHDGAIPRRALSCILPVDAGTKSRE